MTAKHLTWRRFAGFTPWNAGDRIRERREAARPWRLQPCVRWFHYGALRDADLYRALATCRGRAYRPGDAGRALRRRLWSKK